MRCNFYENLVKLTNQKFRYGGGRLALPEYCITDSRPLKFFILERMNLNIWHKIQKQL